MQRRLAILLLFSMFFFASCQSSSNDTAKKNDKKSTEEALETVFKIEDAVTNFIKKRDRNSAEELMSTVSKNKVAEGSFKDDRDGTEYQSVQIGDQWWMAENLKFLQGEAVCYKNDSTNCDKYGRLYSWDEAEKACPPGWHLPQVSEVETLLKKAGGVQDKEKTFLWHNAGYSLKAKTGWQDYDEGISGNGFDVLGFSAIAAGRFADDFLGFYYLDVGAWFIVSQKNASCRFNMLTMGFDSGNAFLSCQSEDSGKEELLGKIESSRYSVRCVKD